MWKKGFARIYTEKIASRKAEKESGKSERGKPFTRIHFTQGFGFRFAF